MAEERLSFSPKSQSIIEALPNDVQFIIADLIYNSNGEIEVIDPFSLPLSRSWKMASEVKGIMLPGGPEGLRFSRSWRDRALHMTFSTTRFVFTTTHNLQHFLNRMRGSDLFRSYLKEIKHVSCRYVVTQSGIIDQLENDINRASINFGSLKSLEIHFIQFEAAGKVQQMQLGSREFKDSVTQAISRRLGFLRNSLDVEKVEITGVIDNEFGNVLLTALREIFEMQDDNTPQTDADFGHLPAAKYVVLGLGEGRPLVVVRIRGAKLRFNVL